MLFNSYAFLFGFLPLALIAFFALGRRYGLRAALGVMVAASLGFYAWWDWRNLRVLIPSLLVNYAAGHVLTTLHQRADRPRLARALVTAAVVFNLVLLGYYKYANFFLTTAHALTGAQFAFARIALPLGISFFTFEQIAYVVDAYRGHSRQYGFLEYCYFVTFFPHLIAGPIIQHNELLDQLDAKIARLDWDNVALGATIFIAGLFKKVVIADTVATCVSPVYDRVPHGLHPGFLAAWIATVGYSLQLYFDFSGYSDMAIGLARIVNVKLPMNFNSPYKATSIIDFWRRWHMTLSRFLRNYLYIPLGGNRHGPARRYVNLLLTMLLGGLWHGAGWGFVIWGGLNGVYLLINHAWRHLRGRPGEGEGGRSSWLATEVSVVLTFVCIMLSRVFFRSADWQSSTVMLRSLFAQGTVEPLREVRAHAATIVGLFALWVACRVLPNTQEILAHKNPVHGRIKTPARALFAYKPAWAVLVGATALTAMLMLTKVSEFLYFQF